MACVDGRLAAAAAVAPAAAATSQSARQPARHAMNAYLPLSHPCFHHSFFPLRGGSFCPLERAQRAVLTH